MPDELIRASVRGAARQGRALRGARRRVQDELNQTITELGREAAYIYSHPRPVPTAQGRTADLSDTRHALDSVRAIPYYRASRVKMRVVIDAMRDGFNYLEAMRHGQNPEWIVSRRQESGRRGFMSAHLAGRNQPPTRLARVRAFRPMVDFVEEAHLRLGPHLDAAEQRMARRLDAVFVETR